MWRSARIDLIAATTGAIAGSRPMMMTTPMFSFVRMSRMPTPVPTGRGELERDRIVVAQRLEQSVDRIVLADLDDEDGRLADHQAALPN